MFSKFKTLLSIAALVFSLGAVAFGQETTGSIEGTVKDPQGGVVPGATVTIRSKSRIDAATPTATASGSFSRTVTSGDDGFFRVIQVPPGFYTVTVAPTAGFGEFTLDNVEVVLGKTTPIEMSVKAGGVAEVVNVTADAVAIDPTDNKIQTNITAQIAELLPKGTNFTSLLQVAPAVRNEPLSGGFQVDGASGSENTFYLDGQEVTNFRTGTLNANNNIPFQFVQEVQVKSSGFEAEFSGSAGGVINVVTKGGGNELHGEFGLQFRPSELQAGPRPFLRLFRTGSIAAGNFFQRAEYLSNPRPGGTDFFPTANLSGPVIKDRLWFFASYTPQYYRTLQDVLYVGSDPRTRAFRFADTFVQKQTNEYAFARLDAQPTNTMHLAGSFTWNPIERRGVLPAVTELTATPAAAQVGNQILRGSQLLGQQGGRVNANNFTGKFDWTPSSNLVISARAGRSFLNEKITAYGVPAVTRFRCQFGGGGVCTSGFQNVNSNFQLPFDVSIRKTFDADASYLVNDFGGRHQFKFGYQYNGISNNTRQGYRDLGIVDIFVGFGIDELSGRGDLVPAPGAIGSGEIIRFATEGQASSNNQALFIQDSWQPFDRLTLNLGLRTERETVPSFTEGLPGIKFNFTEKLAPRLGFAYDLTGNGKTKIFGFYGWFYDRFKYELPRGSFGGDFFRVDYFDVFPGQTITDFTLARILGNRADVAGGNCPPGGIVGGTGLSRCQDDFRIPSNDPSAPIEAQGGIDPDLKAFRQSELTFGLERDLGAGYLFSGRFTHKQIDRAIEDIGFLNANGSEAYIIGNPGFGVTQTILPALGFPATPKAERKYDALELRLDKRFARRFYFNANYTFSRLFGNYPGLASSDEAGRNSPNVNRLFDLPFVAFNANGQPNNGRLPTDRPHVFKFYGAYTLNWPGSRNSTEFSGFTTAQSGTPITTRFIFESVDSTILYGRGDLGRTEAFSQTDFGLRHKYRFGDNERFTMVFDLDVLNLFNESNVLTHAQLINNVTDMAAIIPGDTVAEVIQNYFAGIDDEVTTFVNSRTDRRSAAYGLPNSFQTGRTVRLGFRLLF